MFILSHCSGVEAMKGGLKGINHDKRKNYTGLNNCKVAPSLEEAWNPDAVSSVSSDNPGSECNNDIVTETDESNDVSVKPSTLSCM